MPSILADLNKPQQDAVTHTGSPLRILAGAGSGKTRVLTYRAAWLIQEKKIDPASILLLTFTNKAAQEMKVRLARLLQKTEHDLPFAGTFHSFCVRVLRQYGKAAGLSLGFVIYDAQDQKEVFAGVIKNLGLSGKINPSLIAGFVSHAKNDVVDVEEYLLSLKHPLEEKMIEIYHKYQKVLRKNNALDFDDLLLNTIKLFQNTQLLQKLQKKIKFILVDEWQDTNKAQYKIVYELAKGNPEGLTVVGDASQSIYSWRGADYKNISYLESDFPDLKTVYLDRNYRSSQNILDVAYSIINKNTSHPILKLWTSQKGGEKVKLYQASSEIDEARFVVETIREYIGKKYKLSDCAVLYRINAQSRQIEEVLLHAGLPYTLIGGTRFYERKEIKDILSYLRILANPDDEISYTRAEKIGKRRLKALQDFIKENISVKSSLIFLKGIEATTLQILDEVLRATQYLEIYNPQIPDDKTRLENIKELRSVAASSPNLYDFLAQVSLLETKQDSNGHVVSETTLRKENRINLMTLHSAKGLEFPAVFIIGMEEGLTPHSRAFASIEEMEEERRLVYVGVTRAKEVLFLTFASKRTLFGERNITVPSRFLKDIPLHLVETINTDTSLWKNTPEDNFDFFAEPRDDYGF